MNISVNMTGSQEVAVIVCTRLIWPSEHVHFEQHCICCTLYMLLPVGHHDNSRHNNMLFYYRRHLMFSEIRWKKICSNINIDNGDCNKHLKEN